jgi:hypothetical protein
MAIRQIGELDYTQGSDKLISILFDKRIAKLLRTEAAQALSIIGSVDCIHALLSMISSNEDAKIREHCVASLSRYHKIHDVDMVKALKKQMKIEQDTEVSRSILLELGTLQDTTFIDQAINLLNSNNWKDQEVACRVLGMMKDKRAIPFLKAK